MKASPAVAVLLVASVAVFSARAEPAGPRVLHVPATEQTAEQGILRPVPIALEVPSDLPARRALLHYLVWGAREWQTLELRREGNRYVGAIPCLEVGSLGGQLRYYVRLHDVAGNVIAFSGTRARPYVVAIHHPSARPDLAGRADQCPDPADCPPGLPGCPSAEGEQVPCARDADCEGGQICGWEGVCTEAKRRLTWLGIEVSQGLGVVSARGACSVPSQETAGYACYRRFDGAVYTGRPVYSNEPLGWGRAPTRAKLSFERLISYNTSVGIKLGFAFLGEGPTLPGAAGFMPFSAELLARYWFGSDPFARPGLRPYATFGAGFAEYDVSFAVRVREQPDALFTQGGNDLEQRLRASKRAGDGFVEAGLGAMYPLSDGLAPCAEVSVAEAFPFAATIFSASVGLKVGLR